PRTFFQTLENDFDTGSSLRRRFAPRRRKRGVVAPIRLMTPDGSKRCEDRLQPSLGVGADRGGLASANPGSGTSALPSVWFRVLAKHRPPTRLSRGFRPRLDRGGLDGRADSPGVRRGRSEFGGSLSDSGRNQSLGREFRRLSWPALQHGHAASPRVRSAKTLLPSEDRPRRAAAAIHGYHRADHRDRYHQVKDRGGEGRAELPGEREKVLALPPRALGFDDPLGAHYSATRGETKVRGNVDLPGGRPFRHRPRPDPSADPQH